VTGFISGAAHLASTLAVELARAVVAFVKWNIEIRIKAAKAGFDLVRGVVSKAASLAGDLWDAIKGAAGKVGDLADNLARKATSAGRSLVRSLVNKAEDLPGDLWAAIKGGIAKIGQWERDGAKAAASAGAAIVRGLVTKARNLPGDLWGAIHGAVGKLGQLERDLASKAIEAGQAILRGIVNGIKSAPGAIANAITGLIPGPLRKIASKIPGVGGLFKRRGGKAGPGEGGPAVVYGEGEKTEWWISQEGDRRQNVGWAVEALHELTGRRVAFYKRGHRSAKGHHAKPKPKPLKPVLDAPGVKRGAGGAERGIANFDRDLAGLERGYGQLERGYSISTEEFLVEQPDGTTVIDKGAIAKRVGEIDVLVKFLRETIRAKLQAYRVAVKSAIGVYDEAIKRLARATKRAKGKRRASERQGYRQLHDQYMGRRAELSDKYDSLGLDLGDNDLDIQTLDAEKADVQGTKAPPPPPPDKTADPSAPADAPPETIDSPAAPDAAAPAAAAPPSAADIALAAFQEFTTFQAGRGDLFREFGANFMRAGGRLDPLGQAAGLGAFGATGVVGAEGAGAAGGDTNIEIHNHFAGGPQDPHTWSQQQRRQVEVALTP
jgi:hypothetical protein